MELLKSETVHFVKSVKLDSVYVKLLKPLEPKVSETETGFDITNTPMVSTVSHKPKLVAYLLYQNRFRFPKLSVPMVSTVSHKPKLVSLISQNGQFQSVFSNSINFLKNENKMFL